jgi:hypothetical protein
MGVLLMTALAMLMLNMQATTVSETQKSNRHSIQQRNGSIVVVLTVGTVQ